MEILIILTSPHCVPFTPYPPTPIDVNAQMYSLYANELMCKSEQITRSCAVPINAGQKKKSFNASPNMLLKQYPINLNFGILADLNEI